MALKCCIVCIASLERPYKESVGLGSYTDHEVVVLYKMNVNTHTNFVVFVELEKKIRSNVSSVTVRSCVFYILGIIVGYKTTYIYVDGLELQNSVLFVKG